MEDEQDRRSRFYRLDKPTNVCSICSNYNFYHTSLTGAIRGQYTAAVSSARAAREKAAAARPRGCRPKKRGRILHFRKLAAARTFIARDKRAISLATGTTIRSP